MDMDKVLEQTAPVELTLRVPARNISDLLTTALDPMYGGSLYWLACAPTYELPVPKGHRLWEEPYRYAWVPLWPSGRVLLREDREKEPVVLDMTAIKRGLALFVKHPTCTADLFSADGCGLDATAADVFLQLCVFGEVRYG